MDQEKFNLVLEGQLEVVKNIAEINQTLKFQASQLESHIKRTELLEQRLTPIEDHVKFVQGLVKLAITLSTCGGLITGVLKLLGKL